MFIYRSGFSHTFGTARQWILHGQVFVNNLVNTNIWHIISLHDTVSFSPMIWN
jgi:ribosomal protein S4